MKLLMQQNAAETHHSSSILKSACVTSDQNQSHNKACTSPAEIGPKGRSEQYRIGTRPYVRSMQRLHNPRAHVAGKTIVACTAKNQALSRNEQPARHVHAARQFGQVK